MLPLRSTKEYWIDKLSDGGTVVFFRGDISIFCIFYSTEMEKIMFLPIKADGTFNRHLLCKLNNAWNKVCEGERFIEFSTKEKAGIDYD